jgi:cell division protein FtsW
VKLERARPGVAARSGHERQRARRQAGPGRRRPATFVLLLALTGVLDVVGLVMVLSASSVEALAQYGSSWVFFERQLMWVALGAVALVVTMRVDYRRWRRHARPMLAFAVVLLLAVLVPHIGVSVNGSSRWLGYGSFRVQPSELAKLALLLFVADLFARRMDATGSPASAVKPAVLVFLAVGALVMKQPDMGTTLVMAAMVLSLLFAAGVRRGTLAKLVAGAVGSGIILGLVEPYRRARFTSFLHPWSDPSATGYQVIQSLVGLGSGGLAGVGLGASRAKWGFLPNAYTDFIFSIIGEELGLLGAVLVVALFVAFALLGMRAAARAPDRFGAFLAVGITMWITAQAMLNIGAVIGILPVTGVPLPLVSFGGSSLVIIMGAIGVLLNVASQEGRRPVAMH